MHGWHDVLFINRRTEQVDATRALQSLSLLYEETVIGIDEGHAMNMNGIDWLHLKIIQLRTILLYHNRYLLLDKLFEDCMKSEKYRLPD